MSVTAQSPGFDPPDMFSPKVNHRLNGQHHCVVFDNQECALLVRRGRPPFKGHYALPGGFVEIGETVEQALPAGIDVKPVLRPDASLVGVFSDPKRDPRGHTCSVAFMTQVINAKAKAGDDAESADWIANWSRIKLAFDQQRRHW
jgi:8-oxo-dGTP diphosphatase